MTEIEISRALRFKWPSQRPASVRKYKLWSRHKHRLDHEIERTREKLRFLEELKNERS